MPHKRAKQSVRLAERKKKGYDMAPSKEDEMQIPKGMARVLNAEKTRADHRDRKRQREEEEQTERAKKRRKADVPQANLRIMPGESMRQFSRRVDGEMREKVDSAMRSAKPIKKQPKRTVAADADSHTPSRSTRNTKTEFDERDDRRSVNDVALAPPTLKRPKQALPTKTSPGVVSMAQKRMMEEERERVIVRYREMKQRKMAEDA
ncbi:hypothetical protein FRB96_000449 [Tulasnella sp. 330]|nr:hypothetical protein FRB96_000449 [Tulasnella sp. 330]KAG8882982.1 hypothetical protein FRB98_003361 [Tulasnella sp. 332]